MKLNWPVLKDAKWLVLQSGSILLAVIGLVLAIYGNSYWVPFVVFALVLMYLAVDRATRHFSWNCNYFGCSCSSLFTYLLGV